MSSKLTSAQVIALGEYLDPDFDPSTLTISQLLGVLGYHNIQYPMPYSKPKLVKTFNQELKTRAAKFKKERLKKENSIASDEGILDGHTGQLLNKGKAPLVPRRSSRRISQIPIDEDSSPVRAEPTPAKRRRSSAQPALGRSSIAFAKPPATLVEESEPEEIIDEEDELPIKKVSRKKISTAGKQARKSVVSGDESGWEDNNIFQSGAESSSPVRASPVRPRVSRTSIAPRKSRKSTSAPPQMIASSPSPLRSSVASPPQSPFHPNLPPLPQFRFPPQPRFTPIREPTPAEPSKPSVADVHVKEEEEAQDMELDGETSANELGAYSEDEKQQETYTEELQPLNDVQAEPSSPVTSQGNITITRIFAWLMIIGLAYTTYKYKRESASIGFCLRGTNTNPSLDAIRSKRAAEAACYERFKSSNTTEEIEKAQESCALPPLIPLPHPQRCTPCPDHGTCTQFDVTCDSGYLLKPNIFLSFIPVKPSQSELTTTYVPELTSILFQTVDAMTNGLPLFGSVGFPPRCLADPERKRHLGAVGKSIEAYLARERGRRICDGRAASDAPDDAQTWGVEINHLKEIFKKKSMNPSLKPVFDELFHDAIQQLIEWGGVFIDEGKDGNRYVAHKTPATSFVCDVKVKMREVWALWKSTVFAIIVALLGAIYIRYRMTVKQKESKRVAGLVQVALDTLRNQEMAHYTDPLNAPQPYLSSIQLRDVVLQDVHAISTRRKLWERVERIVEGNANVRANLEEIEGGDETRVWRWVGSTGRTPARRELADEPDSD
ncbi:hypothetical protein CVT24_013179 [Panaeolus cyanescens]|uniref:Man1/Src1 C-terminal domain-containing protein n=1 Tax=Panaeolus cyanescens TaxID=181874 RepID=A0A409WQZ8_9AGAR|nr:hypothetical protein CVT24_013179 [Panaeolus cyanescens]